MVIEVFTTLKDGKFLVAMKILSMLVSSGFAAGMLVYSMFECSRVVVGFEHFWLVTSYKIYRISVITLKSCFVKILSGINSKIRTPPQDP